MPKDAHSIIGTGTGTWLGAGISIETGNELRLVVGRRGKLPPRRAAREETRAPDDVAAMVRLRALGWGWNGRLQRGQVTDPGEDPAAAAGAPAGGAESNPASET